MLWLFFAIGAAALIALWAATWLERWLRLPPRPTGDSRPAQHTDGHHDARRIRPTLHPGLCHGGQARNCLPSPARPPRPGTFAPADLPARPVQEFHPSARALRGQPQQVHRSPLLLQHDQKAQREVLQSIIKRAVTSAQTCEPARHSPIRATHDHFRGEVCLYLPPGLA